MTICSDNFEVSCVQNSVTPLFSNPLAPLLNFADLAFCVVFQGVNTWIYIMSRRSKTNHSFWFTSCGLSDYHWKNTILTVQFRLNSKKRLNIQLFAKFAKFFLKKTRWNLETFINQIYSGQALFAFVAYLIFLNQNDTKQLSQLKNNFSFCNANLINLKIIISKIKYFLET